MCASARARSLTPLTLLSLSPSLSVSPSWSDADDVVRERDGKNAGEARERARERERKEGGGGGGGERRRTTRLGTVLAKSAPRDIDSIRPMAIFARAPVRDLGAAGSAVKPGPTGRRNVGRADPRDDPARMRSLNQFRFDPDTAIAPPGGVARSVSDRHNIAASFFPRG